MIKATFPEGVTAMTVNGLHQWDYGQTLQIQASGLPALVEVHFACDGMKEAVVRSCSVTSDTLTAAIPDICLEQTLPVMAWLYIVGESSGITTLTVTLPIIQRARPQPNATIPTATSDKYTEVVSAMNEAVANVAKGDVTVARAIADENGNNIADTYATKENTSVETVTTDIMARAEELVVAKGNFVRKFAIGGGNYEKDAEGNPVNLPNKNCIYCHATLINYWGHATLYLWGANGQPNYYRLRDNSTKKWSEWLTIVDSNNIGTHIAGNLNLTVTKSVTVTNGAGLFPVGTGLEKGKFYLVTFSGRSGVIYRSSATSNSAAIGEYVVTVFGGEQEDRVQILKADGSAVAQVNGTVQFYKMGTLA